MALDLQHTDLSDPFSDLSVPAVALLPRTLGAASDAGAAASEAQELDLIQNLFKSTVLKSSTKILDQAQVIRKSYSSIQNAYFEAKDKAIMANGTHSKDHFQERRPALGRKRAQFSLVPTPGDSLPEVDFSSIAQIKDPTEYYKALEQLEIAENELKKLRGEAATELTQHQSITARQRRAGILGRTARYKHQDQTNPDMIEAARESHVVPSRRILSPINTAIDSELPNMLPPEEIEKPGISHAFKVDAKLSDSTEGEGSNAHKQKPIGIMLEELFSSFKTMDRDKGEALLWDTFQIRSNDFSKLNLTRLDNTQRNDLRALDSGTKKKFDGSQLLPKSVTHERNILAVEAALRRRISLKYPSGDPDSRPPTDDTVGLRDSPSSIDWKKQPVSSSPDTSDSVTDAASTPVKINEYFLGFTEEMHSPVHEEERSIGNKIAPEEGLTKNAPCSLENNSDPDCISLDNSGGNVSTVVEGGSEEKANDMQYGAPFLTQPDLSVKHSTSCFGSENSMENMAGPSNRIVDENNSPPNVPGSFGCDATLEGKVDTMVESEPVSKDVSSPFVAVLSVDAHSENLCILQEETNEIQRLREASVNPHRGRKRKVYRSGQKKPTSTSIKQKSASRRHSLAGAGFIWKSGLRRSTRIRSRPLEYWRGERFLYGRIHNSLATVIGVKYADVDGQDPVMVVESFVSDQYKDLVDQAALH